MIKLKNSIKVIYEKPDLTEVRVGNKVSRKTGKRQIITSIEPFEGAVPGNENATRGIIFYFSFGNPFYLGYFNSTMSRDFALNIIIETANKNQRLQVILKWEKFFKPSYISLGELRRLVGRHYPDRNFFKEYYDRICAKYNDFYTYYQNCTYTIPLNKIQVDELNRGMIPPEIDKNSLANFLVLNYGYIPRPVSDMGINPFFFWRTVVELNFK